MRGKRVVDEQSGTRHRGSLLLSFLWVCFGAQHSMDWRIMESI